MGSVCNHMLWNEMKTVTIFHFYLFMEMCGIVLLYCPCLYGWTVLNVCTESLHKLCCWIVWFVADSSVFFFAGGPFFTLILCLVRKSLLFCVSPAYREVHLWSSPPHWFYCLFWSFESFVLFKLEPMHSDVSLPSRIQHKLSSVYQGPCLLLLHW